MTDLNADEAALLAGMVASPTTLGEDLFYNVQPVLDRRNTVLRDMWQQGYPTHAEYVADSALSLPDPPHRSPSEEDADQSAGHSVSWIQNQLTSTKPAHLPRPEGVLGRLHDPHHA